jgi:ribulose-phosphate 3-epimerase
MIKVLPSTNPCDEDKLIEYAKMLDGLGVEYIHCDVMDGKFVKNKCLSFDKIEGILHNSNMLLDIHLMVKDIEKSVKEHSKLKPSIITIHIEACKSFNQFLKINKYLREKDIMMGLSIKPGTDINALDKYLDFVDLILVMSVEPGASGQKFIEDSVDRIKRIKEKVGDRRIILEVDGGINLKNYESIVSAGGEFLVMGNAFYTEKNKRSLLEKIDKHYKRKI